MFLLKFFLLKLIYCSVCCESFHEFCLKKVSLGHDDDNDEYDDQDQCVDERPEPGSTLLNWVCPNCKYCEICSLPKNVSLVISFFLFVIVVCVGKDS